MDFPPRKSEPKKETGPIRYLDDSGLKRPLTIPWMFRGIMAVFVVIALFFGVIFFNNVSNEVVDAPKREAEATQENLKREVDLTLPVLKDIIQLNDATIMAQFTEAGYTIYNLGTTDGSENIGFDIIKLPEDVSLIDAGLMYSQGVSKLSSSQAAKLLHGSWRMTVGRAGYIDMSIKYSDFSSGGVEAAVQNAIIAEGLDQEGSTLGESGVDSAGNTFQKGQVNIDGTTYNWQVSACELSAVYSVSGLPTTAAYVGIRMN